MRGYHICWQSKDTNGIPTRDLDPLFVPYRRFDFWILDFITGLPANG